MLLTITLMLLALPLFAAPGTVTFVAGQGTASMVVSPAQFARPAHATGLLAPLALVARVPFQGLTCAIALDADTVDGTAFTRVRLDFTGVGAFTAANSLTLSPVQPDYYTITPTDFSLHIGNRTYPVRISGTFSNVHNQPALTLQLGTEAQARCLFGKKTHLVRMLDMNHNWRFGDVNSAFALPLQGNPYRGDGILIDNGTHIPVWYGQPVKVDGHWYRIALSPDVTTINVTPFTGALGRISLKAAHWTGVFVGKHYMVILAGNSSPQSLPADSYHLAFLQQTDGTEDTRPTDIPALDGTGKVYAVRAKTVTAIYVGAAVIARVLAEQQGRDFTFAFSAMTPTGDLVARLGEQVPFVVTDGLGNKVYENTFENG